MIAKDRLAVLLSYDPITGIFVRARNNGTAKSGDIAGWKEPHGYIKISVDGKKYYAHRLAWLYITGEWPSLGIDHINGVRNDNRWTNLREADQTKNLQNQRIGKGKAKLLGVSSRKNGSFTAEIAVNGKRIYLGIFKDATSAHAAYKTAKLFYHNMRI